MKKHHQKGKVISVNFKGVEGQNNVPNGDYKVKVLKVTEEEGDKAPYLMFKLEIVEGKYKGTKLFHICSLSKQALWNLRSTLEAMGQEIPEAAIDIDLEELEGKVFGVTTEIEKYKGKPRSKVVDAFSLEENNGSDDDDQDDESDDEEEEKPKKKRKAEAEEDDEGDDDDDSGDEGGEGDDDDSEGEEDDDEEDTGKSKSKKKSKEDDDNIDLDEMPLKDLLSLAKDSGIKIPKEDRLNKRKVIKAIKAFIEENE